MIGTTAALILGGAALAGTAITSSNAARAAREQGRQISDASDRASETNERIFNQIRQDNEGRRVIGDQSLNAVARSFGLQGYSGPSMTGGSGSYAPPAGGAVPSMTGARTGGGKPAGGFAGVSPLEAPGGASGPDWAAYAEANPDVRDSAWLRTVNPGDLTGDGQVNDLDRYAYHYQNHGQGEGRQLPSMTGGPGGEAGPAPGYTDPTAPGGYTAPPRPEPGVAPTPYVAPQRQDVGPAPTRQDFRPLDLSISSFRASPDYEFRVQQGNRALAAQASAGGRLMSGSRLKAAQQFGQNIADAEYTDWRNFTSGQYNLDRGRHDSFYRDDLSQYNLNRGRGDALYESDRGYGYGQSRDLYGDWERNRARSDGLYADDRSRLDARYDTRNSTLLNLAGFGSQAGAQNQSAAQSFAQNQNQLLMTGAQARGNAAVQSANAWNQGWGNLMTTGAYLGGQYFGGR